MTRSDPRGLLHELAREYADLNRCHFGDRLSPAPLALNDTTRLLGRFIQDPRGIELSRSLVLEQPWGVVREVLKHEMAHQFVYEVLGHHDEPSHGPSFQRVCQQLGIDPRASGLPDAKRESSPIIERINKLFALAGSQNPHEAEAAMRMAHRLMLKHNIQHPGSDDTAGAYAFRHVGRSTGRISEAESLLAGLLGEFFFVQPIWVSVFRVSDQKRAHVLEITGRPDNLAMAEYVHGFMLQAAESLWREHKRLHGIAGNVDRRAYLAGVMRGFAEKLRDERKSAESTGLVWVSDPRADRYFRQRHPRVRNTFYSSSESRAASKHGRAAGRALVLNRPIAEGSSRSGRALAADLKRQ